MLSAQGTGDEFLGDKRCEYLEDKGRKPVLQGPTSSYRPLRVAQPFRSPAGAGLVPARRGDLGDTESPGECVPPGGDPFSLALLDSSPRGGANGRPPLRVTGSLPFPCRGGACPRPAGRLGRYRSPGRIRSARGRSLQSRFARQLPQRGSQWSAAPTGNRKPSVPV